MRLREFEQWASKWEDCLTPAMLTFKQSIGGEQKFHVFFANRSRSHILHLVEIKNTSAHLFYPSWRSRCQIFFMAPRVFAQEARVLPSLSPPAYTCVGVQMCPKEDTDKHFYHCDDISPPLFKTHRHPSCCDFSNNEPSNLLPSGHIQLLRSDTLSWTTSFSVFLRLWPLASFIKYSSALC